MDEFATRHGLPENPYNPHAWIIGDPHIGDGVWIGAFCVIDGSGGLWIGGGCNLSAGVQVYTHSTAARCVTKGESPVERRATTIGSYVYIGANAVVMMGSEIGDHSIIGAGAVVTEGTVAPPWSLLLGVPARVTLDGARAFVDRHRNSSF